MKAFFIVTLNFKDMNKYQEYLGKVGPTIAAFGGELLHKGKVEGTLSGEVSHQAVGIVGFPDLDALNGWYSSAEYQALIPLRKEAADATITTYSVPA